MPWADPLLASTQYKSSKTAEHILKQGYNPDGPLQELTTPLEIAIQNNDFLTVNTLIKNGANVNIQNKYKETALHLAAYNDASYEVFRSILHANADINSKDFSHKTPLHIACCEFNIAKIKAALNHRHPPVNAKDDEGANPFHLLILTHTDKDNVIKIIKSAIKKGFNVNAQTDVGETVLHVSSYLVNSEALLSDLLKLKGIDPAIQDKSGNNFLHIYLRDRAGADTTEEFLCDLFDENKFPNFKTYVTRLMNHKNEEGYLPLGTYFFKGTGNVSVIRKFIQHVENINSQENLGHSLLHMTVESALSTNAKIRTIKYLVQKGADVNIKDLFGRTPLYYATRFPVTKILIENGASVLCRDQCKRTPLMALLRSSNPRLCQYIIKKGSEIDCRDKFGSNVLHYAAWENRVREVEIFIKTGVNVWQRDRKGRTPLDIATFWRCREAANILQETMTKGKHSKKRKGMHETEEVVNDAILWNPFNRSIIYPDFYSIENLREHFKIPNDLESYIEKVVNCPGIGVTHVVDDAVWVEKAVVSLVETLARQIGALDNRFKCTVFRSGSTSEDTKIQDPDEFDFLFMLDEFSKMCVVDKATFSDPQLKGFVNLVLNRVEINTRFERYFDYDKLLICRRLRDEFFCLLRRALATKDLWLSDELYIDAFTIRNAMDKPIVNFHVYAVGPLYKGFHISIDIVPALKLQSWWPDGANTAVNEMVTRSVIDEGCLLLCQEPRPEPRPEEMREGFWNNPLFRISCAPAEIKLIQSFPMWLRRTYSIAKMMKSNFMCPKLKFEQEEPETDCEFLGTHRFITIEGEDQISSYMLKNSLLHLVAAQPSLLRELPFPNRSFLFNSIWLALRMYDFLGKAASNKCLPVYFLPYLNILEEDTPDQDENEEMEFEETSIVGAGYDKCETIKIFCDFIMKLNELNCK